MSSTMPSAEVFLLGIAAHVLERQHRDGGLVGERESRRRLDGFAASADLLAAGKRNTRIGRAMFFSACLAPCRRSDINLLADLPIGVVGDADAARLGNAFERERDVDAVAEDVVVVDDDVADVDADAEFDPIRCGTSALRSAMPRWTSIAQRTASTALANSTSMPSPVVLTMRPRCAAMVGSTRALLAALSRASVPSSSTPISRL